MTTNCIASRSGSFIVISSSRGVVISPPNAPQARNNFPLSTFHFPLYHRCMTDFLQTAIEAAQAAGGLLRANFGRTPEVDATEAYDIKIELDRRAQRLIEHILLSRFPDHAILGEEGDIAAASEHEWIVDPIDGTVNFFYGIPHFCTSIALRENGKIILGCIYDPMADELWTADTDGSPALLNGQPIAVSTRTKLSDAVAMVGFAKSEESIAHGLPIFTRLVREVKKCRMMGSAALAMAYVATGRVDAYIERQINLWDIAAGIPLIERAGGQLRTTPLDPSDPAPKKFSIVASSGLIDFGV